MRLRRPEFKDSMESGATISVAWSFMGANSVWDMFTKASAP